MFSVLLIGGLAAALKARFMQRGFYGPFDDLTLAVLGALTGESIAELSGVSGYGEVAVLGACVIAALVFVTVAGLVRERPVRNSGVPPVMVKRRRSIHVGPRTGSTRHATSKHTLAGMIRHATLSTEPNKLSL